MVVLVDPSADKQDLPRFRPPKVKSLRPALVVLHCLERLQYKESLESSRWLTMATAQNPRSPGLGRMAGIDPFA